MVFADAVAGDRLNRHPTVVDRLHAPAELIQGHPNGAC